MDKSIPHKDHTHGQVCELCGLVPGAGAVSAEFFDSIRYFCCNGCRMVYSMLVESSDGTDPALFKESDLYRQCLALGVLPASQADLAAVDSHERSLAPGAPSTSEDGFALSCQYQVRGMWCPACAWVIQCALTRMPGVVVANCDFSIDRLHCRYDPTRTEPGEIRSKVIQLGYAVEEDLDRLPTSQTRRELRHLVLTALLTANVMMLSWALYSGFFTELGDQDVGYLSWPILILATVTLAYGGRPILRKALGGLRARAPGMEALVLLGAGSAYLLSVINFRAGSIHLYFDTATMLLTLLLLGKWLEGQAKRRVRKDLEALLSLQPAKVRLCSDRFPNGRFVAAGQLSPGDCIRVKEGEIVPVDGQVLAGRAEADLSAITGEPGPVRLAAGDAAVSGSRLHCGSLDIRVELAGENALLGQMIAVVQNSLTRNADFDRRSWRALNLFVPLLALLAVVTTATTYLLGLSAAQAMVRGITVLVAACPCALGIAVPLARVAGISGAARRGLLVRDYSAFDDAAHIDAVVFDKTGTLTLGRWALEKIETRGEWSADQALAIALALEEGSRHAVAGALAEYASQRRVPAANIIDIRQYDHGMAGCLGEHRGRNDHDAPSDHGGQAGHWTRCIKLGSRRFATGQAERRHAPAASNKALSSIYLSRENVIQAVFHFSDRVRPSSKRAISALQQRGYDIHLISGDGPSATQAAAEAVGIHRYQGGLLPTEKAEYLDAIQIRGGHTAMVGDGVNDAAALAQADLAVAVFSGAPLARQVGTVILMASDPFQLVAFVDWARRVNRKIHQNLAWAWMYNLVAVPLAMAGWVTPLVAVSAMLLSSLTVIGNTLLLVRWPPGEPSGVGENHVSEMES